MGETRTDIWGIFGFALSEPIVCIKVPTKLLESLNFAVCTFPPPRSPSRAHACLCPNFAPGENSELPGVNCHFHCNDFAGSSLEKGRERATKAEKKVLAAQAEMGDDDVKAKSRFNAPFPAHQPREREQREGEPASHFLRGKVSPFILYKGSAKWICVYREDRTY